MSRANLPAAVVSELEAGDLEIARVVPARAKLVQIGAATVGYTLPRSRRRRTAWEMNAFTRRGDLQKLAVYRRANGFAMGPDTGWAFVIGNMCRVLHDHVTRQMIQEEAAIIGCGPLAAAAAEAAVQEIMGKAWGRYKLWNGDAAGTALEVTRPERSEAGLAKIEAMDESGAERRRRENKERMQRKRAGGAALPRVTRRAMAEALNVSLRTLHRRLKSGEVVVDGTDSVRTSTITPYYYVIDPSTESVPLDVRTKNVPRDGEEGDA